MSNDTTPAQDQDSAPADGFNDQPWQVLIGIRGTPDPKNPGNMTEGLLFGMACTPDGMVEGPTGLRPDKTLEAVHFAQWLDRNKGAIVSLWRTEYVQYMNLKRLSDRGVPGLRVVGADEMPQGLVDGSGRPLN